MLFVYICDSYISYIMTKLIFFLVIFLVGDIGVADAEPMLDSPMADVVRFEKSTGEQRVVAANAFLAKLYGVEFIDRLERYDAHSPYDTLCKHVYFRATEYAFYELVDYQQTQYYGEKAVEVMKRCNEKSLEGECESMLAIAHFRQSDFEQALKHAHRNLVIQQQLEDASSISSALNTLAGIYLATRNEEEACEYIKQAIHYSTEARDTSRMAIQHGMASEIFLNLERYEEALEYAHTAYRLDSLKGNHPKMGIRLSQQASPLIRMHKFDEAERMLRQAIPILKEYKIGVSVAICQNQLGYIANLRGKKNEAVKAFSESLPYFMKHHDLYNESKAREGLSIALREKAPTEAFEHMERLLALKDSLNSREMKEALSMAHAQFTNDKLLLQQSHDKTVRRLLIIILVAVGLVCMFLSAYLWYVFRQHRMAELEKQQLEKEVKAMDSDDVLSEEDEQFLKELNSFIDNNLSEIVEVDALALHFSMSTKQLNRKLTAILGCNTYAYVIRRRIEYACELLVHSRMRISDIGMSCGFDNPSNFARAFKEAKGCSPSNFRKEHLV